MNSILVAAFCVLCLLLGLALGLSLKTKAVRDLERNLESTREEFMRQTGEELDKLVGTRTRIMNRQLNKDISSDSIDAPNFLPEVTDWI